MAKLTRHGAKRLGQRAGLTMASAAKMAQKALQEGKTAKDIGGLFGHYLDHIAYRYRRNRKPITRVYGEMVYVFDGESLVTVLHVPNRYKIMMHKKKRPKYRENKDMEEK